MKRNLIGLVGALTVFLSGAQLSCAATLSQLSAINGPTAGAPALPVPLLTFFTDNDENPAQINFAQFVTALQIIAGGTTEFELLAIDSGTGGTSEYLLNQWIVNATGVPWTQLHYSLSARSTAGGLLNVPGLDFDWPNQTATGQGSTNFPSLNHQQNDMWWSGGITGIGVNEITTFAIDVPDIGQDYVIILALEVPEPASVFYWISCLFLSRRWR